VRAATQLDVLGTRGTTNGMWDDVMKLQKAALRTTAR
jgi:hypothetical protein